MRFSGSSHLTTSIKLDSGAGVRNPGIKKNNEMPFPFVILAPLVYNFFQGKNHHQFQTNTSTFIVKFHECKLAESNPLFSMINPFSTSCQNSPHLYR